MELKFILLTCFCRILNNFVLKIRFQEENGDIVITQHVVGVSRGYYEVLIFKYGVRSKYYYPQIEYTKYP